jgi:hypothetical protein
MRVEAQAEGGSLLLGVNDPSERRLQDASIDPHDSDSSDGEEGDASDGSEDSDSDDSDGDDGDQSDS